MNTPADLVSRIAIDPEVCYGRPHVRGARVLVSLVLGFLASGSTPADILVEFPGMEEDDVLACLDWAERRRAAFAASKSAAA
ncbi:MAG TPA: DUF433 domain-containing protein [Isosphaeraceae bacterium]|jgi:uncharacterized protein (DUF433 family)